MSPASTTNGNVDASALTTTQRVLQRFFDKLWVELSIGALIIASVGLTIVQIMVEGPGGTEHADLERINTSITLVFAVELTLRFLSFHSKKRFFREYWLDLLSLLPLLRVFRTFRALRLLRLFRVLRLVGLFGRVASYFPQIARRGAFEFFVVAGLLLVTVLFGTGAMLVFEGSPNNPSMDSWDDAFWFSLYSLFAGEPVPAAPTSAAGKFIAVVIMFMGLTIFAMFTGTVSAFMIDQLQSEGRVVEWEQFSDHIIVCGWNKKAEIIIREYQAAHRSDDQPIVVIAEIDGETPHVSPDVRDRIRFLDDDFTRVSALEQAGIHRASTCILLSDLSGRRTEQDADARTILASLTVEKLNSAIYTCAELNDRIYASHLQMGNVNDYVVSGEHSAYLLAQAALNRGLMGVVSELLTHSRGNQFYRIPLPEQWCGKTFDDLFVHLKTERNSILVAVHTPQDENIVNPESYEFAAGDEIVVIAQSQPEI